MLSTHLLYRRIRELSTSIFQEIWKSLKVLSPYTICTYDKFPPLGVTPCELTP